MSSYEIVSTLLAILAIIVSLFALYAAKKANQLAKEANDLTEKNALDEKEQFKKANTFSMYAAVGAWPGINMSSPVGPDVTKVANLMDHVATIWMENSVDKKTILESVWLQYKTAYEQFNGVSAVIPGYQQSGRTFDSLLSPKIREAYEQMKQGNVHV
ncbi:hypothetical protein D3H65_03760 [Paraflavitalea soli]|uniref:DUF4760 domain-containing protein n=1 Tax=Paraflavitalea soli TaxID=2315862 RepID=A0A3B7MJ19_9BACT|nr:hypothetical protein [Paraflavitalea soli]AXY73140.1 hypothetical protein D3H65_03760 [Paraflavitalea soli]